MIDDWRRNDSAAAFLLLTFTAENERTASICHAVAHKHAHARTNAYLSSCCKLGFHAKQPQILTEVSVPTDVTDANPRRHIADGIVSAAAEPAEPHAEFKEQRFLSRIPCVGSLVSQYTNNVMYIYS